MKKAKIENLTQKNDKKRKRNKIFVITICSVILIPTLAFCAFLAGFAIWANGIKLDKSLLPTENAVPTFYDVYGNKIDYLTDDFVSVEEIPSNLRDAFVALEDKRFYSHKGYDVVRIGGALVNNIKAKSLKEGASTITQQLVKNTHLSGERTIERKLKEIAIATKLEKEYSKDEILSMYLSVIYFGNGAYGVKAASKLYFNKNVSDLTLSECATLAGIVKNPKKYSPKNNSQECLNRRNLVLKIMKDEGYIDNNTYENEKTKPICLENPNNNETYDYCAAYVEKVIGEVCDKLNITKYQLGNSGYDIYTNLDVNIQKSIVNSAKSSSNYESDNVESVMVLIDNKTSKVAAYYSSLPYEVKRQAGSIIKPLAVYAPAIDMGLVSLCTPVCDEQIDYSGYTPKNFADKYIGDTTVRSAIQQSINTIAVKTISYVGIEKSAEYISNFGIKLEHSDKNLSLALGTNSVSPKDIADGYSTLANDGLYQKSSFLGAVVSNGRKIYSESNTSEKRRVIKSSSATIMTCALIDTVRDGTARTLSALPIEIASKTGTVERGDKNSDAWCVSYNNDYTLCVWHGSDDGFNERGGGHPAMQSKNVWQELLRQKSLKATIDKSCETTYLDIDTYTTSKCGCVVLASQNTPIEYRKSEIFAKGQSFEISSTFESIGEVDFKIEKQCPCVLISIDAKDIYTYNIYAKDIFGERLVTTISNCEGTKCISDTPLPTFDIVEYRVECIINANPTIKKSSTKEIFVDDFIDGCNFDI